MNTVELLGALGQFEYQLESYVAGFKGLRQRIIADWVNHEPDSTLSKEQVIGMLLQDSENIKPIHTTLKNIANVLQRQNGDLGRVR